MAAPAIAPASEAEAGVAAIALAIARTTIEPVMILLLVVIGPSREALCRYEEPIESLTDRMCVQAHAVGLDLRAFRKPNLC
jgi:hypothetical protein